VKEAPKIYQNRDQLKTVGNRKKLPALRKTGTSRGAVFEVSLHHLESVDNLGTTLSEDQSKDVQKIRKVRERAFGSVRETITQPRESWGATGSV